MEKKRGYVQDLREYRGREKRGFLAFQPDWYLTMRDAHHRCLSLLFRVHKTASVSDAVVPAHLLRIRHWCRRGPILPPVHTGRPLASPLALGFLLSLQPVLLFRH